MICNHCKADSQACFADDFWDDDICIPCAEKKELIE
jgi:hypothetical protein